MPANWVSLLVLDVIGPTECEFIELHHRLCVHMYIIESVTELT